MKSSRRRWYRIIVVGMGAVSIAFGIWRWKAADPLANARRAYQSGHYEEAAAWARKGLERNAQDKEAIRWLARSLARLGKNENAIAIYRNRLHDRNSLAAEDYFLVGRGLLAGLKPSTGRQERDQAREFALAALEEARSLNPTHAENLLELIGFYRKADLLSQINPLCDALAAVPGREAEALEIEGRNSLNLLNYAEAAKYLEQALGAGPSDPKTLRKLIARTYLRLGEPRKAERFLKPMLEAGKDPEAYWLAARVALQSRKPHEVEEMLARVEESGGASGDYGPEPAVYVGAKRCASCHSRIHQKQQTSRHARTFLTTREIAELKLPDRSIVDPTDSSIVHSFRRNRRGDIVVESTASGEAYSAVVRYVVGSGDRALTLVGRDRNGTMRELRMSRYGDGAGWDRTTGHSPRPQGADRLGKAIGVDALRECIQCHFVNYRAALEGKGPESADRGVSCERCHGPGSHHVDSIQLKMEPGFIARPVRDDAAAVIRLCGQCHAPLEPGMADPDHPFSIKFQAMTLVKSRCFTESPGTFHCLTCHDPHQNVARKTAYYERKCLSCHSSDQDSSRKICPVNPSRDCLSCHMPQVQGTIPHSPFTDHNIRIRHERFGASSSRRVDGTPLPD